MNTADLDKRYRSMNDGELLALAAEPDQLTPEAQISLKNELAWRRINPQNLSKELQQEVKARNSLERQWNPRAIYFFIPELKWLVARIKDWKHYKSQTGAFPILSIFAYALHLVIALFGMALIVWYAVGHHWSTWMFLGILLPLALVDVYLSDWLLGKIRINEITRHRSRRTVIRQL